MAKKVAQNISSIQLKLETM